MNAKLKVVAPTISATDIIDFLSTTRPTLKPHKRGHLLATMYPETFIFGAVALVKVFKFRPSDVFNSFDIGKTALYRWLQNYHTVDTNILQLAIQVEKAKMENAQLKKQTPLKLVKNPIGINFKVSAKGGVSIYGLARFPVTLYKNQWEKVFAKQKELMEFMKNNMDKLSLRD